LSIDNESSLLILDLSSNGTWVNGVQLEYGVKQQLNDKDRITLAVPSTKAAEWDAGKNYRLYTFSRFLIFVSVCRFISKTQKIPSAILSSIVLDEPRRKRRSQAQDLS